MVYANLLGPHPQIFRAADTQTLVALEILPLSEKALVLDKAILRKALGAEASTTKTT